MSRKVPPNPAETHSPHSAHLSEQRLGLEGTAVAEYGLLFSVEARVD